MKKLLLLPLILSLGACVVSTEEFDEASLKDYKDRICTIQTMRTFYNLLDEEKSSEDEVFIKRGQTIPETQRRLITDVAGLCMSYKDGASVNFPIVKKITNEEGEEVDDPEAYSVMDFDQSEVDSRFVIYRNRAEAAQETLVANFWLLYALVIFNTVVLLRK